MNVTPLFAILAYAVLASCRNITEKPTLCGSKTCTNGQRCSWRNVYCFSNRCMPYLACDDIPADRSYFTSNVEGVCPVGMPLMHKEGDRVEDNYDCGSMLTGRPCPNGFTCHTRNRSVEMFNSFPVCCQSAVKPGHCPASLTADGRVGVCAEMCKNDADCDGNSKCCSNGCGHVCAEPVVLCGKQLCPTGQRCSMRNMTCRMGPCVPILSCVDNSVYRPATTPENPCPVGKPLLLVTSSSGEATPVFCGRARRMGCPSNYSCLVAPDDRFAICCYDPRPPVAVPAKCPASVDDQTAGCKDSCAVDADCPSGTCCRSSCGALVCATPDTSNSARETRDGAVLAALLSLWLAHFVIAFAN